jgi:hypothetical protein
LEAGEAEDATQQISANFSRPLRGPYQQLESAPPRLHSDSPDESSLPSYTDTSGQQPEDFLTHKPPVVPSNQPENEEHDKLCDYADDEFSDQRSSSVAISDTTQTKLRELAAQLIRLNLQVGLIKSDPRKALGFQNLFEQEYSRIIREEVHRGNLETQPASVPVPHVDGQQELRQSVRGSTEIRSTQHGPLPQQGNEAQGLFETIAKANDRHQSKRDAKAVQQRHSEKRVTPLQHRYKWTRERQSLNFLEIIASMIPELEELWSEAASDESKAKMRQYFVLIAEVIREIEKLWCDGFSDAAKAQSTSYKFHVPQPMEPVGQPQNNYTSPYDPPYIPCWPEARGKIVFQGTPSFDPSTGKYYLNGFEVPPGFTLVPDCHLLSNDLSFLTQPAEDPIRPVGIAHPAPAHLKYEMATVSPQTPHNPYQFETEKCLASESHTVDSVKVDCGARKNSKRSTLLHPSSPTDLGSVDVDAFKLSDAVADADRDDWKEQVRLWRDV